MRRLPIAQKELLKSETVAGVSLRKMRIRHSLALSTLYYYYRKVNGKNYVSPNVDLRYTESAGEIVGAFAGDGSEYYAKNRG